MESSSVKTKVCPRCGERKVVEEYHKNKRLKDGLDTYCKECKRAYVHNRYVNNLKTEREKGRNRYYKNRERVLLNCYKQTDKKKGWVCDLTVEWLKENIANQSCFYCGRHTNDIGCDRLDNLKGHTMSNVVPCCADCNGTRMDRYTYNEMKRIGELLKVIYKERGEEGIKEELKKS